MAASKKDFVAIAKIIRDYATVSGRTPQEKSWFDSLAIDIAAHFDNTVPTFAGKRFLDACGIGEQAKATGWTTEETIWVQTQAPAGNWCDSIGLNGDDAEEKAQGHAKYLRAEGRACRIIQRQFKVIH